MNKDLQKATINWSYEDSIKTTKFIVEQFKKCSLHIVQELYIAREQLLAPGYRSDLRNSETSAQMSTGYELHI